MFPDLPVSPYRREFIQGVRAHFPEGIFLVEDKSSIEGLTPVSKGSAVAGLAFDLEKEVANTLIAAAKSKGANLVYLSPQEVGLFVFSCVFYAEFYRKPLSHDDQDSF